MRKPASLAASALLLLLLSQARPAPSPAAVTNLRVGLRANSAVLVWDDPEVADGFIAIFRSLEPITAASLQRANRVASVPLGKGTYTDTPDRLAEWYYAALYGDANGTLSPSFASSSTVTAVPIMAGLEAAASPSPAPAASPVPSPTPGSPPLPPSGPSPSPSLPASPSPLPSASPRPSPGAPASPLPSASPSPIPSPSPVASAGPLGGIQATVDKDLVRISYAAPTLGHKLIVYRGTDPVRDSAGILQASIVSIVDDSVKEVRDYPIPGIDYYYAVVDENDIKAGSIKLALGSNSTLKPVRIETGMYRIGLPTVSPQSRSIPLPFLSGTATAATGGRPVADMQLPERASLSPETEKAISSLLEDIPPLEVEKPDLSILPEDQGQPSSGEAYTLGIVVQESLKQSKWEKAAEDLEKFLSIHRSAETELRARFYLGQSYAMAGRFRDALFSLLLVQDSLPQEVKPWRDYCLRELHSSGDAAEAQNPPVPPSPSPAP